jgi:hypothetical protein
MIRTLLIATALLAAAGAAQAETFFSEPAKAETVKVSLAGKTEATVKTEVAKASKQVCRDVVAIEYAACVNETYHDAMAQVARITALRTASLGR